MDTQTIRCPVPIHGTACGREELLEKRRAMGARPGSRGPAVHHECGEHQFHTHRDDDQWSRCDCLQEDE
jgi:hypothetical protein